MKILITSIVDLKKSQQTLRKFDQNASQQTLRKLDQNASQQTLRKFDQNVQHFGWMRPHQFVEHLLKKHGVTVLCINDWWKANRR